MKEKKKEEIVRADLNLERWDIFTTRHSKQSSRVLKKVEIQPDGSKRELVVKIGVREDGKELGVLTATEGKLFYQLINEQLEYERRTGQVDKPVEFSIREVAENLGLGWHLKKIKLHFEKLLATPLSYIESYEMPDGVRVTKMFTLLSRLELHERKEDKDQYMLFKSKFQINPVVMESIRQHYARPIRLDVIKQLRSDIAFILYRYVDRVLYYQERLEIPVSEVVEMCGLSKDTPLRVHKQRIKRALKELVGKELSSEDKQTRYVIKRAELSSDGTHCVFERSELKGYLLNKTVQEVAQYEVESRKKIVWFRYRNAHAKEVRLAGSFNGWKPELMGRVGDEWSLPVELVSGKYHYKFVVDGVWVLDPTNPQVEKDSQGNDNSVLVVE